VDLRNSGPESNACGRASCQRMHRCPHISGKQCKKRTTSALLIFSFVISTSPQKPMTGTTATNNFYTQSAIIFALYSFRQMPASIEIVVYN